MALVHQTLDKNQVSAILRNVTLVDLSISTLFSHVDWPTLVGGYPTPSPLYTRMEGMMSTIVTLSLYACMCLGFSNKPMFGLERSLKSERE